MHWSISGSIMAFYLDLEKLEKSEGIMLCVSMSRLCAYY